MQDPKIPFFNGHK